jgi:hypothetical protein
MHRRKVKENLQNIEELDMFLYNQDSRFLFKKLHKKKKKGRKSYRRNKRK